MKNQYDVIICGGGLAGLTLALQLKKNNASISILIIEKRNGKAAIATHKVGESTVELGAYYLAKVLGLQSYLEEKHLPKYGLRFWFKSDLNKTELHEGIEYGIRYPPPVVRTYQVDRGILENDLLDLCENVGVGIMTNSQVKAINFSKSGHEISIDKEGKSLQIEGKWVIDATGQRALFTRDKNNEIPTGHNINAVWFRIKEDIDIDDWIENRKWKERLEPGFRKLATNHIMGKGYWIWIIPLPSGITSIGIVADSKYHAFQGFNTFPKAMEWLTKNEPVCFRNLEFLKDEILDFKRIKNYSWNSKTYYSHERWGITGIAAAFLDPFYSPGTDFIALDNTWLTDLIIRDFNGENIFTRATIFNKIKHDLFDQFMFIYKDMYGVFVNPIVMQLKIFWDCVLYWGFPALLFCKNGFTNVNTLKQIKAIIDKQYKLQENIQIFFKNWNELSKKEDLEQLNGTYIHYMDVPILLKLFLELCNQSSSDDLIRQINNNLSLIEEIAAEIFRVVSHRYKNTPINLKIDPYSFSLSQSKEELELIAQTDNAIHTRVDIAEQLQTFWLFNKEKLKVTMPSLESTII